MPVLVFLGLSVLDLGPMYATDRLRMSDRQTDVRHHRLMSPPIRSVVIIIIIIISCVREADTICIRPLQVDLWPFDLESGVRVTCDVAYLCANISLPRPLCSRLRPDVCDRQTSDVRQTSDAHHRLMPPPYGSGGIILTKQRYVYTMNARDFTVWWL